jgi:hypothetical protein
MHAVLALAHFHDLAFATPAVARENRKLLHHWHRAVSSLNRKLSQPIIPAERDAIWLSATILSIGCFSATAVDTPDEAWPLRPPSALDLNWLKLCNGKRHVAELTTPLREDSAFRKVSLELTTALEQLEGVVLAPPEIWGGLPDGFFAIFELSGEPAENPYHRAVVALHEIYQTDLDPDDFLPCLSFTNILDIRFRHLLHLKDERAMLILLYWYARICNRQLWWIWRHSWTEGLAICHYLDRAWASSPNLLAMLDGPRTMLVAASGEAKYHKAEFGSPPPPPRESRQVD